MAHKPPGRNQVIDLLRGYFLFVIGVDHAYLNPNYWNYLTGQNMLWVSAAEGFFFISGMMTGLVRRRQMATRGRLAVLDKIYGRVAFLYAVTVSMTIVLTVLSWIVHDPLKVGNDIHPGPFWSLVWDAITFQYVYGWINFLPFYVVFLFMSPLVLWLMRRRLDIVVMIVSLNLWWFGRQNQYLAWQVIFVGGMLVGYHWQTMVKDLQALPQAVRAIGTGLVIVATVATIITSYFYVHYPEITNQFTLLADRETIDWLMDKTTVGPGRLAMFGLWFSGMYLTVYYCQDVIVKTVGWFLLPLGRQPLGTYVTQAWVLFGLKVMWPADYLKLGNTLWIGLELALVWLIVARQGVYSALRRPSQAFRSRFKSKSAA